MTDPTESMRRDKVAEINGDLKGRAELEEIYGKGNVWDTAELITDFKVISFAAPYVMVERISDGVSGILEFQHSPRFYYDFSEK